MRQQVAREHYSSRDYYTKGRFLSWYHQVWKVLDTGALRVLEIGPGVGVVRALLQAAGLRVVTVDIAADLAPNVLATIEHLPFGDDYWDLVLCCQVLEHIPFAGVDTALSELRRVTRSSLVISVPDVRSFYRIDLGLPFFSDVRRQASGFLHKTLASPQNRSHFWELGCRECSLGQFAEMIEGVGLRIVEEYRVFEHPYYHFFHLERRRD